MLKPYFPELFKTWLNSELTRGCVYQDAVKTCLCMTALLCSLKKEGTLCAYQTGTTTRKPNFLFNFSLYFPFKNQRVFFSNG